MSGSELLLDDGEYIGPYRIVKILGRGGMGEVFLARDDRLKRCVAIKRIRNDSEMTPVLRQRLLREAQAVVNLDHPAIVRVHHLQEHAGDDCIVMEYVQGETLAEILRDGPLEQAFAVRVAKEVASGLAVAHEAGIIHRDLKAENVMITPSGAAKILDFGLAKPRVVGDDPSLTAEGFVVGTRRSMSPEQLRGAEVDERSDLFSLGVLLYEMLTGSSPFQGANAQAILCNMFRSGAPPRLVALLERLLAREPAARPQSAAEVVQELEAIATSLSPPAAPSSAETISDLPTDMIKRWEGEPSPAVSRPQPPAEKPRPLGNRRVLEIAVLLALVVLLGGTLLFRFPVHQKPVPVQSREPAGPKRPAIAAPRTTQAAPPPQAGTARLNASEEDLSKRDRATLDEIKQSLAKAETPPQPEKHLDQLNRIVERSPHSLEARILAIEMALASDQKNREKIYSNNAVTLLSQANLGPSDPGLLPSRFKVELATGRLESAKNTLSQFENLKPRDPRIPELRSRLAEAQGQIKKALAEQRKAVKRHRSWQNLLRLAKLEEQSGQVKEARGHLAQIRKSWPNNIYAPQRLAELELNQGNPEPAVGIYQNLIGRFPQQDNFTLPFYTNLGAAFVLLSRYDEAVKSFKEARTIKPDDIPTILNLADAELWQGGHTKEARELYRQVCKGLSDLDPSQVRPIDEMNKAQCLAHLDETQEAMGIAQKVVEQNPEDATMLQAAAMVYAIAHERKSLQYIDKAIKAGIQPSWFKVPSYDYFKEDPDFRRLVDGDAHNRSAEKVPQ